MAHEVEIREDPGTYVPRNVFGHFSRRTALAGVILGPPILAIIAAGIFCGWPQPLIIVCVVIVAGPLGGVALAPVHGLHAEKWLPLVLAERRAPREMVWTHPVVRAAIAGPVRSRRERRALRMASRLDRAARRTESEALSGAFSAALSAEAKTDTEES